MTAVNMPPGPRDYFFGMQTMSKMKADVVGFYTQLQREYGDTVSFQTGPYRLFVFFHPEQVYDVLVKHAKSLIRMPRIMQTFAQWNGNSILIAEGKEWISQRRLVQQAFQPKRIEGYAAAIIHAAEALANDWKNEISNNGAVEVDVRTAMRSLSLSIICRTMFDSDVSQESAEISEAVEVLSDIAFDEMQAVIRLPMWIPTSTNRKKRKAIETLDRVVWKFIRDRRQEGEDHGDLLSILLSAVDDESGGAKLNDQQVRDEAMTLMLAGHDTTAAALEWLMFVFGRYPEVAQRCREEADSFANDQLVLADLSMLNATVKETLRLFPPAFAVFTRQPASDLEIGGYQVPKGSMIALSSFVTQRDERWFDDPTKFRPERFLGSNEANIPKGAYFPFGLGPRVCVGQSFAMKEIELVAAILLRSFEFDLMPQSNDPMPSVKMALRPSTPIKIRLRNRA